MHTRTCVFLGVSGIQARPVVVLEGQVYGILYLLMNDFSTICKISVHPACTSDTLSMLHRPIDNFNHGPPSNARHSCQDGMWPHRTYRKADSISAQLMRCHLTAATVVPTSTTQSNG